MTTITINTREREQRDGALNLLPTIRQTMRSGEIEPTSTLLLALAMAHADGVQDFYEPVLYLQYQIQVNIETEAALCSTLPFGIARTTALEALRTARNALIARTDEVAYQRRQAWFEAEERRLLAARSVVAIAA